MKKNLCLITVILSVFILTGCKSAITLTDRETEMLAEYIAGYILNNEANYTGNLVTPTPTEAPEETKTSSETPTGMPVATDKPTGDGSVTGKNTENVESLSFADVIGQKGVTIEYDSYEIVSSYTDGVILVEASVGKKILVVSLKIKNSSDNTVQIDLWDFDMNNTLKINDDRVIKSNLTFLENDLRFFKSEIKKGKSTDAVVLFNISDNLTIEKANFVMTIGKFTASIDL